MNSLSRSYDVILIAVRHGQTHWNLPEVNLMQGCSDGPENELNATGLAQAEELAETMWEKHNDISRTIYSSNLKRAVKTAEKTAAKFQAMQKQYVQVVTREDLQECNFGNAEGKSYDQLKAIEDRIAAEHPDRKARWSIRPVPNMETYHELSARAKRAFTEIAEEHLKQADAKPGQKVAAFTSGRIIRILLTDILNKDDQEGLPNCGAVLLGYTAQTRQLEVIKIEKMLQEKPKT